MSSMLEWGQEELERYLQTVEWDFIGKEELEQIPFIEKRKYPKRVARKMLEQYAESLFKISASRLGIYYSKRIKKIYKTYNSQFYQTTKRIGFKSEDGLGHYNGETLIKMCETVLLPKPLKPEKLILKIRKLSDEELGELMMYIAGKKIEIKAVDRD